MLADAMAATRSRGKALAATMTSSKPLSRDSTARRSLAATTRARRKDCRARSGNPSSVRCKASPLLTGSQVGAVSAHKAAIARGDGAMGCRA